MDTFANMDTTADRNTPYTNRLWIITALSLRYNDALTYREIAEKLNISASATHKMFTRFRRPGIAWPLPADYSPEKIEAELYAFNLETKQPVKKRRPDWPLEFKIRMAELSLTGPMTPTTAPFGIQWHPAGGRVRYSRPDATVSVNAPHSSPSSSIFFHPPPLYAIRNPAITMASRTAPIGVSPRHQFCSSSYISGQEWGSLCIFMFSHPLKGLSEFRIAHILNSAIPVKLSFVL